MVEPEKLEPLGGPVPVPSEDSASAYEASDSEQSLSTGQEINQSRVSGWRRESTKLPIRKETSWSTDNDKSSSEVDEPHDAANSVGTEERIRESAVAWAATFQAPGSLNEIRYPKRSVSRPRKRKLETAASESRAKRLKPYHNVKYRELMNIDIHDAASRMIHGANEESLPTTQIGISIWTSQEKERFYLALQRLGRDELLGISDRIGTKSEQEVQQYILLHHDALAVKRTHDGRTLPLTEIPSAFEISEECCTVLERAGDALASRQELYEEKAEKAKWGDAWLVTETVAHRLDRYRRDDGGEEAIDEVLPASNLFSLKNWLELSNRVFMNSEVDENWQNIAEEGERPAVRATAFEDFHSLAYNYTKRLIQTTLFCAMSREKAMGSKKLKYAEVKSDDVGAAVAILKLPKDSKHFWMKCASRNKLRIVDDELPRVDQAMGYNEVESALLSTEYARSRSRSRSQSFNRPAPSPPLSEESSSLSSLEEDYLSEYTSEPDVYSTGPDSDSSNRRARSRSVSRAMSYASALRAEEEAVEQHDIRISRTEEARLWEIMEQEPPFEVNTDEITETEEQKGPKWDAEGEDWRERMEVMSIWESLKTLVPLEAFERNRKRVSRRARRREEEDKEERVVVESDEEADENSAMSVEKSLGKNDDEQEETEDSGTEGSVPDRSELLRVDEGHRNSSGSLISGQEADIKSEGSDEE